LGIDVDPHTLSDSGDQVCELARTIHSARSETAAVGIALSGACGERRLAEAVDHYVSLGAGCLDDLTASVEIIGRALVAAGANYANVDQAVFRGGPAA
jgi:hypothetical protein